MARFSLGWLNLEGMSELGIEVSDGIFGDLRGFRYGMEDFCSRLLAEETRRMEMDILRQHDYGKWFRSVVIGKPVWE